MSIERRHSPEHWRDRAKEIRAKADNCEYPETRDALRNTAECYDALARSIENISHGPTPDGEGGRQAAVFFFCPH